MKRRKKKEGQAERPLIEEEKKSAFDKVKEQILSLSEKEIAVMALEGVCLLHTAVLVIRYVWCFIRMDRYVLWNNPLYLAVMSILPLAVWVYSTTIEFWNFRNRKVAFLCIYTAAAILTVFQPLYTAIWRGVVPQILKLKPNQALTEAMIVWMCRAALFVPLGLIGAFLGYTFFKAFLSPEGKEKLYRFKLTKVVDTRKNKEYLYDFKKVVRDLHTGEAVTLQEEDLRTGVLLNGPSGTGKTSSVIIPIVRDVMDQKVANKIERQKEIAKMLKKEEANIPYYKADFAEKAITEEGFIENAVVPEKGNEKKLYGILEKHKNAGITVMAPNNGYIKDVLRLAKARKIRVNVLDPAYDWTKDFPETAIPLKINPFYIPEELSEKERIIAINNRAAVFSEVLVALNEQNKESDIYFKDINLSMTSNIAAVVMSGNAIRGRQTEILEIQAAIDNPMLLEPYIAVIEEHYNTRFETSSIAQKKTSVSKAAEQAEANERMRQAIHNRDGGTASGENADFDKIEEIIKRNRENPLFRACQFVKDEVLSDEGRQKMYDQSRGLRNLLSIKLLNDTRITNILSAHNREELLDFDRILANGEITLVNTAVEFASGLSTAFGLFFQLNLRTAVFRRDPKNKLNPPHFLIIDEVSQYVHQFYNDIVSFYRQYNIISCLSIQSLTQLESKESTKYLSNLFQSIGTHIVYGRLSGREMKIYEEMSGQHLEEMVQATYSHNSLLASNPSITQSDRVTPNMVSSMTGSEMRYRDFQEVIVFTSQNGDVLKPFAAKVSFTPEKSFYDYSFPTIHWEKFVPEPAAPIDYERNDEEVLIKQARVEEKTVEFRTEIPTKDALEEKEEKEKHFRKTIGEEIPSFSADEFADMFSLILHPEEYGDDASSHEESV